VLSLGVALLVLASATASHAKVFIKISDGTNTLDGLVTTSRGGLMLSKVSPAPAGTANVTDVLNVLTCPTRPCTVHFPSGNVAPAAPAVSDTFTFTDVLGNARVEKFDSGASADRVSFKGVKITSRVAGRVLTITYGVQSGDLRDITSTSGSYTGTAALTGTFKTAGGAKASACNNGATAAEVSNFCVRLSVALNGTTVNGAGASAVATVSVPCNNAFPTTNPCGTGGIYTFATGSFNGVNDSKSIGCASPCRPTQVGTMTAEFNATGDVLQLTASANGAMANVGDEVGGGEEVLLTLADELGTNRWTTYTATAEPCRALPQPPLGDELGDVPNKSPNATTPIKFRLECGVLAPLATSGPEAAVDLVSIVDPTEGVLAGSAGTRNDASRAAFLPAEGGLKLKNVNTLKLNYEVVVGLSPSGDSTLGDLTFSDCANGSIRVELELVKSDGTPAGTAKVYLGDDPYTNFKSGCSEVYPPLSGANLVNNPDKRVDASGLTSYFDAPCCITFAKLKYGARGNLLVRRIVLVVDQGQPSTSPANYKVRLLDGTVNGITALAALQVPTGFEPVTNLSTNGVSIVIRKLTGPTPGIVKVIPGSQIMITGPQYHVNVGNSELSPDVGGSEYAVNLCLNGAEEGAGTDTNSLQPTGLCIPDQGYISVK
jgi:hypothetical protein